jgi:hypothetical protein
MKHNFYLTLLASTSMVASLSCRSGTDVDKRSQPVKPADDTTKVIETQEFTSTTSDGRPHVFANWANYYDKIDFSRLHPKTREFYQTTAQTDIVLRNSPADFKSLWTFTNFQDSVAVTDVIRGVRRACQEEQYTSIKACVDDAIARSGSVVFAMKVPEGSEMDPNSDGHIKDALYGLMGATFITAKNEFGVNEERMTAACISCHNSTYAKAGTDGRTRLVIDGRGDNSYADVLARRDYFADFTKFKNYVNAPNDPIWDTFPETRAAGYIAAQYSQLKDAHGHKYNINENRLVSERERGNIKSAVDAGWVSAFANWISTAESFCYDNSYANYNPSTACDIANTPALDSSIARSTAKTTAVRLLAERENLLMPWSVTPPLRSQRSILFEETLENTVGMAKSSSTLGSRNFALDYVRYSSTGTSDVDSAIPYLLSATSISLVMPGLRDDALARAWYGNTSNAVAAEARVNLVLPRTILANYTADARIYHAARVKTPLPLPRTMIQTITQSELNNGATSIGSCTSCHANFTMNLASNGVTSTDLLACQGKAECEIFGNVLFGNTASTYGYSQSTPSSVWAQSVMAPMVTAPASMHGGPNPVPRSEILAKPDRIPFINRQAIGLWGYLSSDEALKPAASRHGAAYGIVGPVMTLSRNSSVRTVGLNWDFDGNGIIGLERLFCLKSQAFDLDRNGTRETSCFEALRVLGGGTPRSLGDADSANTHVPLFAGVADATSRSNLAKVFAAYGDGAFVMRWSDNTTTHIKMTGQKVSTEGGTTGGAGTAGGTGSTGGGTTSGGGTGPMMPE